MTTRSDTDGVSGQTEPCAHGADPMGQARKRWSGFSSGHFYDAREIDELLVAQGTMTLTDGEEHLARATDPRAKAVTEVLHDEGNQCER